MTVVISPLEVKLGAPTYSWFFGPTMYGQIEGFADHVSIILKKCLGDIKSRFLKGFLKGGKSDGPLIVGILFRWCFLTDVWMFSPTTNYDADLTCASGMIIPSTNLAPKTAYCFFPGRVFLFCAKT